MNYFYISEDSRTESIISILDFIIYIWIQNNSQDCKT